jgi:hypothetical protein
MCQETLNAFALLRHKFQGCARILGPLDAGRLEVDNLEGRIWLSEAGLWMWGNETRRRILVDREMEGLFDPTEVCRLLYQAVFDAAIEGMHRLDAELSRAYKSPSRLMTGGVNPSLVVLNDHFALQDRSAEDCSYIM